MGRDLDEAGLRQQAADRSALVGAMFQQQPATGLQVLQRFKRASDESPWHEDAAGLSVTLSIGVTAHHLRQPLAAGIESADRALYAAKRAGRARIECV